MDEALQGAQFVQESGPEDLEIKQRLYRDLGERLAANVIIASSTSNLAMSDIQKSCRYPERTIVGHPINPPYAVPLVEVVPGMKTSPETVAATVEFYTRLERQPMVLDGEPFGFVANRLQMAVIREAFQMVMAGEATVSQIDQALMYGIALRWTAVGAFGAFAVNLPSGKPADWLDFFEASDYADELSHFGRFSPWDAEQRARIVEQWDARLASEGTEQLMTRRDKLASAIGLMTRERPAE